MQKLNIYLVEDNPLLASVLKHTLLGCGYNICGLAPTYEKAVSDLPLIKPDLVVTDIMLASVKTGIDVAEYINRYLQIPFIFQSSVTDKHIIESAMAQQPLCYLAKPLNRTVLLDAIATYFSLPCEMAGN